MLDQSPTDRAVIPAAVIPAQAGTHFDFSSSQKAKIKMDDSLRSALGPFAGANVRSSLRPAHSSLRWNADGGDDGRKRARVIGLCIALSLTAIALPALAADYTQAAGSSLTFAGNYQGEVFTGRFPGFSTKLSFDPKQLAAAKLDVTIPLATATTGNSDYDGEMRGAAFFNSAKFAQARYTATKFRSLGGNRYAADGTLSLRGASKPVTLTFTWTPGAKPVLAGKATVKRLDFGVGAGEWADTKTIPNDIAINAKVVLQPL